MKKRLHQSLVLGLILFSFPANCQEVRTAEEIEMDSLQEKFDKEYGTRYYDINVKKMRYPKPKPKPEPPVNHFYPSPLKLQGRWEGYGILV